MSVVVVAFNTATSLERCLVSLERQTLREGVETIVVRRWDTPTIADEPLQRRFQWARWVQDPRGRAVPQLRSVGIAHSRGEIIALLEDDCVAAETWCAAVVDVHRGPCVAVGGAVEPGGCVKPLDWAVYFSEYVRFMQPVPKGAAQTLPGTNVSYKRVALRALWQGNMDHDLRGDGLGFYEVFVHGALRRAGQPMAMDPAPVVHNVHSWECGRALTSRFHHGRGFAAIRVYRQPFGRRLCFLAIAAVLPFIQVARIAREVIARRRHVGKMGMAIPWILALSISWSIGELVGYLRGPGGSLTQWR